MIWARAAQQFLAVVERFAAVASVTTSERTTWQDAICAGCAQTFTEQPRLVSDTERTRRSARQDPENSEHVR